MSFNSNIKSFGAVGRPLFIIHLKFTMNSIVLLIFLTNTVLLPLQIDTLSDEDCCRKTHFRTTRSDIMNSFHKFSRNLKAFFRVPFTIMESKRLKLKRAFQLFIGELQKEDNNITNANQLSEYAQFTFEDVLEVNLIASELIQRHGYKCESHSVVTTDGYILTVHRIPPLQLHYNKTGHKIVLLHHGLLGSSDDWLLLGPKKALPYLLSDAGYDVWLANARGNKYSSTHSSRSVDSAEFWNFSWHEIGQFDLAAVIDYIRWVTEGKSLINFIGHSMGTTALLVLLSTIPQYNLVLRSATFLGPLAFMYQTTGPLRLLAEFQSKQGVDSLSFLGEAEFMSYESFPRIVIEKFCQGDDKLCSNPWLLMANGGKPIFNDKLKLNILNRVPAGGSTKTITHYAQLIKSGQFYMFDLGPVNNMKKYGLKYPPSYRLNDVTVPVALFSSNGDWLSTIADVLTLLPNLPNPVLHHVVRRDGFSHTDFVWAEDAPEVLYYYIMKILEQVRPIHINNKF